MKSAAIESSTATEGQTKGTASSHHKTAQAARIELGLFHIVDVHIGTHPKSRHSDLKAAIQAPERMKP
jgi:hypothetical protein